VLEGINKIDHSLFLYLNGHHTAFMDSVMFKATQQVMWSPLFLILLYLCIRQYKWNTLIILCAAATMILVSDQLANLFKDGFQRLRPSHEPGLAVHLVNAYKGGVYGFYSSHASNSFAITLFLFFVIGKKYKWVLPLLLAWAFLFSYTRIYLGVHFPGDILMGATMGGILGFGFGTLVKWVIQLRKKQMDAGG
jgi:undecaprenyl-diphosphatase